jgi:DNA polymerase-1
MSDLTTLVTRAQSLGVSLEAEGEEIRVRGTSRLPASLLVEIKAHKRALLTYLTSSRRLLDDAGVRVEYKDTDAAATVLLGQVLANAGDNGPIGFDVETCVPPHRSPPPAVKMTRTGAQVTKPTDDKAGLDPHRAQVRLVQIYGGGDTCAVLDMRTVSWAILAPLWARKLVIHNSQFELAFLRARDIYPEEVECTMQGAGLMLGTRRRSLAEAVGEYLGWQMPKGLQVSDWGAAVLSGDQLAYAALDAVGAFLLWAKLKPDLETNGRWDAYILQRDAVPAAVEMAWCGIGIDTAALDAQIADWSVALAAARADWERETGTPPPGKPADIRAWLECSLHEADLAAWPRTEKTGQLATGADDLEQAGYLPAMRPLLSLKRLEKLLSSFGSSLKGQIGPVTGRVHARYNVAGAKSGRWKCSGPNLQQIPTARLAPGLRDIFKAPEGRVLIGADYSQMELRAAAEISGDMALRKIYADGLDLHQLTAAAMASVAPEAVTKEQRDRAKPVNFGSIFGMGGAALAATAMKSYRVEMTLQDAEAALRAFFRTYPTLKMWMRQHYKQCRQRRRIVIGIGRVLESAWEPKGIRYAQCCNLPVQGACADVMMRAVAGVYRRLHGDGCDAVMVAMIHDELILEADAQDAEAVGELLAEEMTAAFAATFPDAPIGGLVDVKTGSSWSSLK